MQHPSEPAMESPTADEDTKRNSDGIEATLGTREKISFLVLMIMSFYAALESTSIGVALPNIAASTRASSTQAFWIGTSYLLASAVCQPPFAAFSHIFGRRPVIIFTLLLFIAGSIICALAHDVAVILVGRVLQGIGSGGGLSLIEIIITDLVPLKQRGGYFGLISLAWALGSAISPLIGGAFTQKSITGNSGSGFRLNPCRAGVSLVVLPVSLRLEPRKGAIMNKVKQVDCIGCFLLVSSATSTLIAISWGGIMFSWSSAHTLAPLLIGIAGIAVFVLWEIYFAKHPLIPMSIFNNRTAATVYWQSMVSGFDMWACVYYLPLYFEAVHGYSPILAGVAILPTLLSVALAAAVTGFAIRKTGAYRKILWLGWSITVLGSGLMMLLDVHKSPAQWVFIDLVGGLGVGMLLPVMRPAVQASSSDENMAVAAALTMTMRTLGMSLGIAVLGIIFQNVFQHKLNSSGLSGFENAAAQNVLGFVKIAKSLPDQSPEKEILRKIFADSLKIIWAAMLAFSAVSLLLSFLTEELSLDRVLNTEQGVKTNSNGVLEPESTSTAEADAFEEK
ncbi:MFS general substrate transporter [Mollisia scopiformis]|uniref:MFS general substrate transporter n=1 Tax=Mollisia scopiformis TaxID=149040 RepID=A0A194X0Q9_MOLSC|nr:MFS general substrate transporter [Mollisia scopiformis]KUJ13544.1 MFS general substrate transporter [Mollisia scopiformis]